uniref:Ras- protein Rab-12 n=1 Tax=Sphaerodactylus townsendi TaxID=933632 RepID=A0ACB8FTJ0_9SAUR
MEPGSAGLLQRRGPGLGGPGSAGGSPGLSGPQGRRRKQPPRPADFKLQVILIGSRGVGKTSLMERFTDDTFCEACKSTVDQFCSWGVTTICKFTFGNRSCTEIDSET